MRGEIKKHTHRQHVQGKNREKDTQHAQGKRERERERERERVRKGLAERVEETTWVVYPHCFRHIILSLQRLSSLQFKNLTFSLLQQTTVECNVISD